MQNKTKHKLSIKSINLSKKFVLIVLVLLILSNLQLTTFYAENGDFWNSSPLEEQGIDPELIEQCKADIDSNQYIILSMLIIKNGYLVEEEYFGSDLKDHLFTVYSVTKSITATCIGIAIDQGLLNLEQTVLSFFLNETFENIEENKESMTIRNLLMMSSGLDWNEWNAPYIAGVNDFTTMRTTENWVQYILDKPMDFVPGTEWDYNSGNFNLLSAILQRVYNNTLEDFAKEYLFGPLGITNFNWPTNPQGISDGGSWLKLRARDMAKIGYLYLQDGIWGDQQILSYQWVQNASTRFIATAETPYAYGYSFFISSTYPVKHYSALGWNGQRIFIVPEKDLVVVFTSYDGTWDIHRRLLEEYIIPATNYEKESKLVIYLSSIGGGILVLGGIATLVILWKKNIIGLRK